MKKHDHQASVSMRQNENNDVSKDSIKRILFRHQLGGGGMVRGSAWWYTCINEMGGAMHRDGLLHNFFS